MRNFNSHLSADSGTSGISKTFQTAQKIAGNVASMFGETTESNKMGNLEENAESGIRQASDLAPSPSPSENPYVDPVGKFYRANGSSAAAFNVTHGTPRDMNPDGTATGYNSDYYTIGNYNFLVGAPTFAVDSKGRTVAITATYGHLNIFNPLLITNQWEDAMKGTFHFRDTKFDRIKESSAQAKRLKHAESCTVRDLVEHPLGQSRYFYEDFMLCADLGKFSNNHLITLRKFPSPCADNIFHDVAPSSKAMMSSPQDMGRLLCYFGGADNKLEDICRMSFSASWKEFTGDWQEMDTGTDNGDQGPLGVVANLLSPGYCKSFASGTMSGRGIGISGKYGNPLAGEYSKVAYSQYDKHKIYTPKNIINKNYYYEGIMDFQQSFTLTFRYKMRSFSDTNQKAALLDLIANILNVTYRRASFWGGGVNWIGSPQNNSAFNTANNLIDKAFSKIGGVWDALMGNGKEWNGFGDFLAQIWQGLKSLGEDLVDTVQSAAEKLTNMVKSGEAKEFVKKLGDNALNIAKGAVKNKLGRPHVYALNSLVSGANTGLWHVTVGNPFNPIMAIGNLIIDKVDVQHAGPLTIDDFPEELIVKITLKHAKPRDITGIAKMYTRGLGELYTSANSRTVEKILTSQIKEPLHYTKPESTTPTAKP